MNLYGFAGGDPVNFSDPFGLCPECRMGWGAPTAANALKEADYYGSMSNGDRVGLMALGAGAAAGGAAVMAGTASLMASAAPMLPIIPSAMGKLEWLAEKFGGSAVGIANRAVTQGTRLIDKGNKCNVNCLIPRPDGAAGWLRVTLDPSQSKVISAGLQSVNQVTNGLAKGRFTPVGPP
jgi:hypothetical protein